jgi:hypothetical protein
MGDYFFSPTFEAPKREDSVIDVPPHDDGGVHRVRESKRKRQDREQREEEEKEKAALVVIGYESKMFRDPETAAAVNEGKFLVPWMGDKSLMIDRYDVRLLLDDRKAFKKVKGKTRSISKEEVDEEAQCDYQRYYDLEHYDEDLEKGILTSKSTAHPTNPIVCIFTLFLFFIFSNWIAWTVQALLWIFR